ncbi:SDR family oxidoreductase [Mycobacterium sp. M26]|uniref:SDR family oxidoreductase n=1 Tax=Mycobacterium sp. M26 TaxID=1762962 RepID=UPI00073F4CCA|nr:SDR family oxidoreductase [Mycobacterium sp. M26]
MKITVVGATGLIGTKVVAILRAAGHDVVGAARSTGADVLTGDGLADALDGAEVLVDVTNSPSLEDQPVLAFFTAASANLVAAARAAGVGHYVALSIVGVDGLPESGYMRAKVIQERTIIGSGLPYTIVRATQFHEFADMIVGSLLLEGAVHAPDARIQPIAAAEVAAEVADAAQASPANGIIDIGGPEKMSFTQLARTLLASRDDDTPVMVDPAATYFGLPVGADSLVTGHGAVIADTKFNDWLATR